MIQFTGSQGPLLCEMAPEDKGLLILASRSLRDPTGGFTASGSFGVLFTRFNTESISAILIYSNKLSTNIYELSKRNHGLHK